MTAQNQQNRKVFWFFFSKKNIIFTFLYCRKLRQYVILATISKTDTDPSTLKVYAMPALPIDIVILTYNRRNYFEQMLQSIHERTTYPYRLIVVDNGSSSSMTTYLRKLEQDRKIHTLILNRENLFMHGWHYGLTQVTSPLFAISDPDIVVPDISPCWLTQMIQCFEQFSALVRLGVTLDDTNIPPCWNRFETRFLTFQTGKIFAQHPLLKECPVDTTLQLIRTDIFRERGGFTESCIEFEWLKGLREDGTCAVHNEISVTHLGWNEYRDYPDYLREKHKMLKPYREIELIENTDEPSA